MTDAIVVQAFVIVTVMIVLFEFHFCFLFVLIALSRLVDIPCNQLAVMGRLGFLG